MISMRICDATNAWLLSKNHLAATTLSAYKGEANRLEQFLRAKRVRSVTRIKQEHWLAYLEELRTDRATVLSKRQAKLSNLSIQQAQRITRSFLLWARDEGLIDWAVRLPKAIAHSSSVASSAQSTVVPIDALPRPLGIASNSDDEATLRVELIVNLIYWGALKPAEVAGLEARHIGVHTSSLCQLHVPARKASVFMPASVWALWLRYRAVRKGASSATSPSDPLICSLNSNVTVTAWTVWSVVKQAHPDIQPRNLRRSYIRRVTDVAVRPIQQARSITGTPNLLPLVDDSPVSVSSMVETLGELQAEVAAGQRFRLGS